MDRSGDADGAGSRGSPGERKVKSLIRTIGIVQDSWALFQIQKKMKIGKEERAYWAEYRRREAAGGNCVWQAMHRERHTMTININKRTVAIV